jgi:leucyl-tRNA synthetase
MLQINPPKGSESERSKEIERMRHYTIKMVTIDLERFHFNTAISRIMELVNSLYLYIQDVEPKLQHQKIIEDSQETIILLLAPFAPHFAEELWEKIGKPYSIFNESWPPYDEAKTTKKSVPIVIQINGKVRATIECEIDAADDQVLQKVLLDEKTVKHIEGKSILKKIVVKNRLVNLVVK